MGGLGHGSGAHAPNEYMVIEPKAGSTVAGLAEVEKGYVDLLFALAKKIENRVTRCGVVVRHEVPMTT